MQIKAVLLCNRYVKNFGSFRRTVGRLVVNRARFSGQLFAGAGNWSLLERRSPAAGGRRRSVPLAELRLENVVDVDNDAADAPLVDLDLVQMRGGVRHALR